MPRIDVNGIDCRNDKNITKNFIKSLNGILEKNQHQQQQNTNFTSNAVQQNTIDTAAVESHTESQQYHTPKVFAADSIKVNTPAKDVLGPKFDHFAKSLKQQQQQQPPPQNHQRQPHSFAMPAENSMLPNKCNGNGITNGHATNGILTNGTNYSNSNGNSLNAQLPRLQPLSACYDRYPKPGSYGSLQVFPMNGVNSEINNAKEIKISGGSPLRHHRHNTDSSTDELTKLEQDRLEEVLKMCADFERQNQSVTASPIVQNRIKTNGSLPREKKSPLSPDHMAGSGGSSGSGNAGGGGSGSGNVFFPSSPADFRSGHNKSPAHQPSSPHTPNTGYENVKLFAQRNKAADISSPSSHPHYQRPAYDSMHASHLVNGNSSSNGYENLMSPLKSPVGYVPQSPRTRIKTCISPKKELTSTPIQRKTDYDLLVQSFEEKLRLEIQQFRENRTAATTNAVANANDSRISQNSCQTNQKPESPHPQQQQQQRQQHHNQNQNQHQYQSHHQQQQQSVAQVPLPSMHQYVNINRSMNSQEGIYGTVAGKQKPNNHLTVNIRKNLDEKQIAQLKKQQIDVLRKARDIKAQISELQRQEEEVLRELDLEKALVSAELNTEQALLDEMENSMIALQAKIHRLEAQRNANRVLQETQQNKLKQSIDMKQNQIDGLKKLIGENELLPPPPTPSSSSDDDALKDELNETIQLLENDTKTFEDLEFQYLEEETEWLAYREDLHSEQKTLSRRINEKRKHIKALEVQGIDNQNAACADTKMIEKDLWTMLKELEKYREELKTIDTLLYELSGETGTQSGDSDEDSPIPTNNNTTSSFITPNANNHSPNKRPQFDHLSQSLYGSQEILSQSKKSQLNDLMSKSVNENLFSNKIETLSFVGDQLLTKAEKESDVQLENCTETDGRNPSEKMDKRISSDRSANQNGDSGGGGGDEESDTDEISMSAKVATKQMPTDNDDTAAEAAADDDSTDPLQKLKYNLSPPFANKATSKVVDSNANDSAAKSPNLNLSIESDDFEVNPLERRVPSQDDIDRICKVTSDAPISTQGASYKVIESIKEIERNRQLLLTQQGSHVIEHERQKMSELKKKSHDEARAQYLQLQNHMDDRYRDRNDDRRTMETVNNGIITCDAEKKPDLYISKPMNNCVAQLRENVRHSHPEYDYERPLSEVNSEISYDALSDKQFKSSSDIRRIQNDYDGSGGSQRGSMMSSENSDCGRMVSGARRSLPKHQRPLTRYLPIMSADLDLRLHIESAGHQVTLCPHVIIDSFSCRGYLHKLGATFHTWSKRWFVLDRQKGALIYYSDKSERKPRGGAYFTTIDEVYLDHLNVAKSGRPHCTFIVKTKRRSYHLQAASDAAARIWIDAIITGAQGNIDY